MNTERIFMQSLTTYVQPCGKPVENYAEGNPRKKAGRSCFGFCLLKNICSDKDYLGIT